MAKLQDLDSRETLQLSMGLLGNPKYFNSGTSKDSTNVFHIIHILTDTVFASLKDGTIDLAGGVLSTITVSGVLYSQDGFTEIELTSGIIKAVSIANIQ